MVSRGAAIHIKYAFGLAEILLFVLLTVVDAEIQSVEPVAARRSSDVGSSEVLLVDITVLRDAATKGAVCLDGSPPAYNLHRGFGSGANSWLINMEGGGWCNNVTSCLRRAHSHLGSSLYMGEKLVFSGILTNNQSLNPDFYNWNRVAVRYCDGSSFTGDVEEVNQVTKLRFRGQRIWQAVMEDLLAKGMDKAEQALLTGCSAGGLTTFLHCDEFRDLLPETAKVKCMPDAGFFIDEKDISGGRYIRSYFNEIVTLQGSSKNLPHACTTKMELDSSLCFFPQYLLQLIETPLFVLNAAYDSWQIKNILAPSEADPYNQWQLCKLNILNCTPSQLKVMQGGVDHIGNGNLVDNFTLLSSLVKRLHTIGFTSEPTTPRPHLLIAATCSFRYDMLSALKPVRRSRTGGLFINSCYAHCQTNLQSLWHSPDSPRLNSKTIAEAVGDWFFNRTVVKDIDCPYPCDSTCHNRVFTS